MPRIVLTLTAMELVICWAAREFEDGKSLRWGWADLPPEMEARPLAAQIARHDDKATALRDLLSTLIHHHTPGINRLLRAM